LLGLSNPLTNSIEQGENKEGRYTVSTSFASRGHSPRLEKTKQNKTKQNKATNRTNTQNAVAFKIQKFVSVYGKLKIVF
jgi:hypothetical protein